MAKRNSLVNGTYYPTLIFDRFSPPLDQFVDSPGHTHSCVPFFLLSINRAFGELTADCLRIVLHQSSGPRVAQIRQILRSKHGLLHRGSHFEGKRICPKLAVGRICRTMRMRRMHRLMDNRGMRGGTSQSESIHLLYGEYGNKSAPILASVCEILGDL